MEKMPDLAAYYTFVDGYLVASNSEASLTQAIQNRQAGYTLVASANFRNQLPADNFTNFSAILYNNLSCETEHDRRDIARIHRLVHRRSNRRWRRWQPAAFRA